MDISPYLIFNGNCAEAFKLYENALGGRIVMSQTHAESPMKDQLPADWHGKILHIVLEAGGRTLMGSDAPAERYAAPEGIQVAIAVTSPADAERIFQALSEGGTVTMPIQKTFWSPAFGMTVDRFGIPWMVNCQPAA
jgi:PhnB protein